MATETLCLKSYLNSMDGETRSKKRKNSKKKSTSNRVYGLDHAGGDVDMATMGESILCELLSGDTGSFTANVLSSVPNIRDREEEEENTPPTKKGPNKIDTARQLFQALINRPDATRQAIIQAFEEKIGVTHSTSVSYYERLAKEAGLTGQDEEGVEGEGGTGAGSEMTAGGGGVSELTPDVDDMESEDDEINDTEREGIIRTIDNAHLIYKEQNETGSFDELWIYNISKGNDEMEIRRDILAGTDIPPKKTKSPDGSQSFSVTTMGNAQYLHLKGLQN